MAAAVHAVVRWAITRSSTARAEYAAAQRGFAERAAVLRDRLLAAVAG
ncbi:hypothetical protein ACLQ29_26845 [Micromonospora sp. DT228]